MITRLSAAIVGLLAFAGCILVGLAASNPFGTIVLRALGGLAGGLVVGYLAGRVAQSVVYEQFRIMVAADIESEMTAEEEAKVAAEEAAAAAEKAKEAAESGDEGEGEQEEQPEVPAEQMTRAARAAQELLSGMP